VAEYLEGKKKYEDMRKQKLKKGSSREAQVTEESLLKTVSAVIYSLHTLHLSHLAEALVQSDFQ
jgi:hypothetical protein